LKLYEGLHITVQYRGTRDEYQALPEQWVKMAKDRPDDPLALLLAGEALKNKDTPEAIRLLEAAKAKAPNFPWPAMQLALPLQGWKARRPDQVKGKH
jgi:hypothetical protein